MNKINKIPSFKYLRSLTPELTNWAIECFLKKKTLIYHTDRNNSCK